MQIRHRPWAGFILILIGMISATLYSYPAAAATVPPQRYTDTPGCTATSGGGRNLGYSFGITINPPANGSFRFTPSSEVSLTGPIDSDENLRLNNVQTTSFDWSSTLGMDAVIVHGAAGSHVYVYEGESRGDNALTSMDGASITRIEFCYDYELGFDASATGTFVIGEQWTLQRTVSPEVVEGFIGEVIETRYTIRSEKETAEFDYDVRGLVTVANPSPYTVDLILNVQNIGRLTSVTCGTTATVRNNYLSVPGNTTANCEYRTDIFVDRSILGYWSLNPYVSPTGEGNAVIVPVPIEWTSTEAEAAGRINDTMFGMLGTPDQPDGEFMFDVDVQCPTDPIDYTNGIYRAVQLSRASVGSGNNQLNASNSVQITCYAPTITNRAIATYSVRQSWDITRTVQPAAQAAFAGETVDLEWITELQDSVVDETPRIRGDILITNPSSSPATVSISVTLDDGTTVRIDSCDGAQRSGNSYSIPSLTQATCQYSANPINQDATISRAALVLGVYEFVAETELEWRSGTELTGVRLVDDASRRRGGEIARQGGTWTTPGTYTCPTEARVYNNNGMYFGDVVGTGILFEGSFELARASATANITCYLPKVSHTTTAGYELRHQWDITAGVTPDTQEAWAGETVEFTWNVGLTSTLIDEGVLVRGTISVFNPHPIDELEVDIGAALDDRTLVTLECGTQLTIAAGMTETCDFVAQPDDTSAERSIASISFNRVTVNEERELVWAEEPNQVDRLVAVDDDHHQAGLPVFDVTGGGEWTYTTTYTCPLDAALYEDGVLEYSKPNSAFVFTDEDILGTANARTAVTCLAPIISTTADASYIQAWDWTMLTSTSATELSIAANETAPISYLAMLAAERSFRDVEISGEITIENPHDRVLLLDSVVNEAASGVYARISCDTLDIQPESSVTCQFSATPDQPQDGATNVRVGLPTGIMMASAEYEFEILDETDECVMLQDSHFPQESLMLCGTDEDLTYGYTLEVGAEGTTGAELEVACGLSTHENRITMITSDSEEETVSNLAVTFTQECTEPEATPESEE